MEPPAVLSLHKSRRFNKQSKHHAMKTILHLSDYRTTRQRHRALMVEAFIYISLSALTFFLFRDTIVSFYSPLWAF